MDNIEVVEWLTLQTSHHEVLCLHPTVGGIQFMTVWCFIALSLSLSPFHCLNLKNVERDFKHQIGAKVSCILRHRGVKLRLAYSWARPAILAAGKGREGVFFFFCFFTLIHFTFSHLFLSFISSTISSVSLLPFSGRQHKMTHKGWHVVKPNTNKKTKLLSWVWQIFFFFCLSASSTEFTTHNSSNQVIVLNFLCFERHVTDVLCRCKWPLSQCYGSDLIQISLTMQGKNFSRQDFETFSYFSQQIGYDISCKLSKTICMKCQVQFSGKSKKKYHQFGICWICQSGAKCSNQYLLLFCW